MLLLFGFCIQGLGDLESGLGSKPLENSVGSRLREMEEVAFAMFMAICALTLGPSEPASWLSCIGITTPPILSHPLVRTHNPHRNDC